VLGAGLANLGCSPHTRDPRHSPQNEHLSRGPSPNVMGDKKNGGPQWLGHCSTHHPPPTRNASLLEIPRRREKMAAPLCDMSRSTQHVRHPSWLRQAVYSAFSYGYHREQPRVLSLDALMLRCPPCSPSPRIHHICLCRDGATAWV
jgi:hypothetical protein